jgi:hypothetical protein
MAMLNLDAFSIGTLKSVLTILTMARTKKFPLEKLERFISHYIRQHIDTVRLRAEVKKPLRPGDRALKRCSQCGHPAKILPVNVSASTQVGGDYKIAFMCNNEKCLHTEYTVDDIEKVVDELSSNSGFETYEIEEQHGIRRRQKD